MDTMAVAVGALYAFTHPQTSPMRMLQSSYGILFHRPLENQKEVNYERKRGQKVLARNHYDGTAYLMNEVKPILQAVSSL
jgi:hypothetical protein